MKNIKDYILEGSWGYEIDQNDGTLDLRADIYSKICELVYDECDKYSKGKDTSWAWEALGAIEYFFEDLTKLEDFGFTGSKDNDFDKYYSWWKMIKDKKSKNILNLFERLLNKCKKDEKWISDWKEPDKMRKSLDDRQAALDRYKKLLENRHEYEKKINKQQNNTKSASATDTVIKGATVEEK